MSRYEMGCRFHGRSQIVEVGRADYYDRLDEVTIDPVSGRISRVESEGRCEYGQEWTEPEKIVCQATIPAFSEDDPDARTTCGETLAKWEDGEGWVRTRFGVAVKVAS